VRPSSASPHYDRGQPCAKGPSPSLTRGRATTGGPRDRWARAGGTFLPLLALVLLCAPSAALAAKRARPVSPLRVSASSLKVASGKLSGAVTVTNRSGAAVGATHGEIAWRVAGSNALRRLAKFKVPALGARRHKKLKLSAALPKGVPAGTYQVLVCVDQAGRLGLFAPAKNCRVAAAVTIPRSRSGVQGSTTVTTPQSSSTSAPGSTSTSTSSSAGSAPTPTGPLSLTATQLSVESGSIGDVVLPSPLASITSIDASSLSGAAAGVTVQLDDASLEVDVAAGTPSGAMTVSLTGTGCTASSCGQAFSLSVPVVVAPITAPEGDLDSIAEPSPDRVAAADDSGDLDDSVLIILGSPSNPGTREEADAAAASVDAVVAGGLSDLGIYELEWTSPQDISSVSSTLAAQPDVAQVAPFDVNPVGAEDVAIPVASQYSGAQWTWPYTQVDAPAAWALATGSNVPVGIVDQGNVFAGDPNLNVVQTLNPIAVPAQHATLVGGLACGRPGVGIVGLGWGCPLVTEWYGTGSFETAVLQAMDQMASVSGVRVVNASLGYKPMSGGCLDQTGLDTAHTESAASAGLFRQLFLGKAGSNILWTFSASNLCGPGPGSPWTANSDLANVLSVAATNSDGSLASFSDYGPGVNVAAPGGVHIDPSSGTPDTDGIESTSVARCPGGYCAGYASDIGTSFSAPIVAGIGALEFSANPNLSAAQAGRCILNTAGTGGVGDTTSQSAYPSPSIFSPQVAYSGSPIPIVNAAAAVACAQGAGYITYDGDPGTNGPPATMGPYTMQTFSPDSTGEYSTESSITSPIGQVGFDEPASHLIVPSSWATWSNGYTSDVYQSQNELPDGGYEITLTLPPGTGAFYLYGEPDAFQSYSMTATANDGTTSGAEQVEGEAGASFFGFYASCGHTVSSVTVDEGAGDDGMAVGEFGIAPELTRCP